MVWLSMSEERNAIFHNLTLLEKKVKFRVDTRILGEAIEVILSRLPADQSDFSASLLAERVMMVRNMLDKWRTNSHGGT